MAAAAAASEDAATVLEQFVHDVANLPAELAHLLEEIHAKDQSIQECRTAIAARDWQLQRHVKAYGGHVKHPKEEQSVEVVRGHFEKADGLQRDKIALASRASFLLDRHVKRLDVKIRQLENDGAMAFDPQLPSLLRESSGNLVQPSSTSTTGGNTPLNALNLGPGGSTNIANAAMARMANMAAQSNRSFPAAPVAGMQPHPLLNNGTLIHRQRDSSVSAASDGKRRRLNLNLSTVPNPSSGLARPPSLGPGTPPAGTPVSRAGSTGPRTKKTTKSLAPHQQLMRKKLSKSGLSKKSARRLLGGIKASPSTTGDEQSEESDSNGDNESAVPGKDGAMDDDEVEGAGHAGDDDDDNQIYCTCQTVSHGSMVACDNENCRYQWFHWECVGLTKEPPGKWLCPDCKKLPPNQIKWTPRN